MVLAIFKSLLKYLTEKFYLLKAMQDILFRYFLISQWELVHSSNGLP